MRRRGAAAVVGAVLNKLQALDSCLFPLASTGIAPSFQDVRRADPQTICYTEHRDNLPFSQPHQTSHLPINILLYFCVNTQQYITFFIFKSTATC